VTEHSEGFKKALDWLSTITAVGALTSFLPQIAALFTIIWYGIRIWESDTVRRITKRPLNKDWVDTMTFRKVRQAQEDAQQK
jgi:hypothetical protein